MKTLPPDTLLICGSSLLYVGHSGDPTAISHPLSCLSQVPPSASFLPAVWSPPQHPQTGPSLLGWEDARRKCLQSAELRPGTGRHSRCRARMHCYPCQHIPGLPACLQGHQSEVLAHRVSGGAASLVRAHACCPTPHTTAPAPSSSATSGAKVIVTINGTPKSLPDAPCLLPARGPDKLTSLSGVRSSCPHQCQ